MKTYAELLAEYIDSSGLTLSQIEVQLRQNGFSTNKAYISKLKNAKLPPAGDDINKALAEVLNVDQDELIILANMERSPIFKSMVELITNSLRDIMVNNLDLFVKLGGMSMSEKEVDVFKSHMNAEMINMILEMMSITEKLNMVVSIFKQLSSTDLAEMVDITHIEKNISFNVDTIVKTEFPTQSMEVLFSNKESNNNALQPDEVEFLSEQLNLYRRLKVKNVIK